MEVNMDDDKRKYRESMLNKILGNMKPTQEENKMSETKSRYEVMSELEEKKRALIKEREGFHDIIKAKKNEVRNEKRELEDMEDDLKDYEGTVKERKETIQELIGSIDESLKRFNVLLQSQKK